MAQFDEIKNAFWDESTSGVQPPLTEPAIRDAERILGVKLPAELLHLLRLRNGGGVRRERRRYPTSQPTSWADDHVPFDDVMGIGYAEPGPTMLDTPYLVQEWDLPTPVQEWDLPTPVVLLTGDGHWWIGLDYRASGPHGEPAVTWFDTDDGTELILAPDFRSFVQGLQLAAAGPAGGR